MTPPFRTGKARAAFGATLGALLLALAPAVSAQLSVDVTDESSSNLKIVVPALPAQAEVSTPAGGSTELGRKIAEVIAADLKGSGLFDPSGPNGIPTIAFPEVTSPAYDKWGAYQALVQGFVRTTGGEADITVGCYLYDVALKQELTRQGYVVAPATGAGPRINAPTPSMRACRAKAPSSTAASPISRRAAPRGTGPSASPSWIRTARTTASSPTASRSR